MENIIITKIHQDVDSNKVYKKVYLFKLEIFCVSAVITAKSNVYVTPDTLNELVNQIKRFACGEVSEGVWCSGIKGNSATACTELRFISKDRMGHVLIEVFMEIDDGADFEKHNCCFYVNTELGRLDSFVTKISKLYEAEIGFEVSLNE